MTRQRELERNALVAQRAPLVTETMPHVAHPQIRNRGTIGGAWRTPSRPPSYRRS
jgi:carbon-monoxide dehydrogenase medium subunit